MSPSNPLTSGFRAVLRAPTVLLVEVLWRWCFGLAAGLLLFFGWLMAIGSVNLSAADRNAWQSHDLYLIALTGLHLLVDIGAKLGRIALAVLPAVSALWIVMSAAGRTITMKRLAGRQREISLRAMLILHFWRALVAWGVVAVAAASVMIAALIANRGPTPDYVMYYALALPMIAIALIFWSVVNWYLTAAAAWVGRSYEGVSAGASRAIRLAMGFASARRGDMAGLNIMFTLLRLMALAVAFVLCTLPGGLAASAPRIYVLWVIAVSLAYFVFADFVHVSRLASYLQLDESATADVRDTSTVSAPEGFAVRNGYSPNGR
jgi:hypothetical protein